MARTLARDACVFWRELVPVNAMGLPRELCGWPDAAQVVFAHRDWLKVRRIYATAVAAQVVNDHARWYVSFAQRVGDTVRVELRLVSSARNLTVSSGGAWSSPFPTSGFGYRAYIRPKAIYLRGRELDGQRGVRVVSGSLHGSPPINDS